MTFAPAEPRVNLRPASADVTSSTTAGARLRLATTRAGPAAGGAGTGGGSVQNTRPAAGSATAPATRSPGGTARPGGAAGGRPAGSRAPGPPDPAADPVTGPRPAPPTTRRARPSPCGPVHRTPGFRRVGRRSTHARRYEPARVVLAFLGKHRVRGAAVRQRPRDELVRAAITLVAQPARVVEAHFGAQGHEHPPGRARRARRPARRRC